MLELASSLKTGKKNMRDDPRRDSIEYQEKMSPQILSKRS